MLRLKLLAFYLKILFTIRLSDSLAPPLIIKGRTFLKKNHTKKIIKSIQLNRLLLYSTIFICRKTLHTSIDNKGAP